MSCCFVELFPPALVPAVRGDQGERNAVLDPGIPSDRRPERRRRCILIVLVRFIAQSQSRSCLRIEMFFFPWTTGVFVYGKDLYYF